MRDFYDTCKALIDYFKIFANLINDILFFQVPILDVSVMTIMFGTGFILYVGFVLAKFVVGIIT